MSASAAKEMRRDIRRALGPVALETLDAQADAIRALDMRLRTLAIDHTQRIALLEERADAAEAILHRNWRGRLRFLFTGR